MTRSTSEIILETVCPLLGALMANIMFAAPFRSVRQAQKDGRLGKLNPTPWAIMTGNTIGWITYGILKDNYYIFFGNAPGFLLSVWFNIQAIKLQYENYQSIALREILAKDISENPQDWSHLIERNQESNPRTEREGLSQKITHKMNSISHRTTPDDAPQGHERLLTGMIVLWLGVVSLIGFGRERLSQNSREIIVGIIVNLNLVFFYGAPLTTILTVTRTRSTETIHVGTMITNTLNGIFWACYGIAVLDFFVAVPNGIGALLGGIQVFLFLIFPREPLAPSQLNETGIECGEDCIIQELEETSSKNDTVETVP